MEGRLGRTSSRYGGGAATVFTGPVRKWKKKWTAQQLSSSNSHSNSNHHHLSNHHNTSSNNNGGVGGGATNNNGGSHLIFYKWSPLPQSNHSDQPNLSNQPNNDGDDSDDDQPPPKRKFKFFPVALLEEQLIDSQADTPQNDDHNDDDDAKKPHDKPDMNHIPMEETQEDEAPQNKIQQRQDLNEESTLDLSLGFTPRDGDQDFKSKADNNKEG